MEHQTPLAYPAFRMALTGRVVSTAGSWMQTVAAGWLIYKVTDSAAAVGFLAVLAQAPGVLFSLVGGDLADRVDRRRLIIGTSLLQAAGAGLLALLAWDGVISAAEVCVGTLLIGMGSAVANPALQTVIADAVPPRLVERATALNSLGYNLARLFGPAIGGVLTAAAGAAPCFAINAISFVAVAGAMTRVPARRIATRAGIGLREAIRRAAHHDVLRDLLLVVLFVSLLIAPIGQLTPVLARDHGEGAHWVGFLLTAMAVGGIIGNRARVVFEHRGTHRRRVLGLMMLGCGLAMAVLAVDDTFAFATVAMVSIGICWEILFVTTLTGIQLEAPEGLTGRAVGLFFTATLAGAAAGAAGVGGLLEWLGNYDGLLLVAAVVIALGLSRLFRARDLRRPPKGIHGEDRADAVAAPTSPRTPR